jgi:hypothetical protein
MHEARRECSREPHVATLEASELGHSSKFRQDTCCLLRFGRERNDALHALWGPGVARPDSELV